MPVIIFPCELRSSNKSFKKIICCSGTSSLSCCFDPQGHGPDFLHPVLHWKKKMVWDFSVCFSHLNIWVSILVPNQWSSFSNQILKTQFLRTNLWCLHWYFLMLNTQCDHMHIYFNFGPVLKYFVFLNCQLQFLSVGWGRDGSSCRLEFSSQSRNGRRIWVSHW